MSSNGDAKGQAAPGGEGPADHPGTGGVNPDLLAILVCPMGRAELKFEDGHLRCVRCGPRFLIDDGIPIMLIEEAKLPEGISRIEDLPCYPEVAAREAKARGEQG